MRRPLNLLVTGLALTVVLQGMLVMTLEPPSPFVMAVLFLTLIVAYGLFRNSLEQISPAWIRLTPDSIRIAHLLSWKEYAWTDVLEVATFPVSGRLCDESADSEDVGLGLRLRSARSAPSDDGPDVCIVSLPYTRGRELDEAARRIRSYQHRAMSGLMRADLRDFALPGRDRERPTAAAGG